MKQFGDPVVLKRDQHTVNALVVQSTIQPDGEHLTVVYLDPTKKSPFLSGAAVDNAIKRDFVTPLAEGKVYGWRDPELGEDAKSAIEQLAQSQDDAEALRKEVDARVPASEHDAVKAELAQTQEINRTLTQEVAKASDALRAYEAAVSTHAQEASDLRTEIDLKDQLIETLQKQLAEAVRPVESIPANPEGVVVEAAEPSASDPTSSTSSGPSDQTPTPTSGEEQPETQG
jgi:hypothetical protein